MATMGINNGHHLMDPRSHGGVAGQLLPLNHEALDDQRLAVITGKVAVRSAQHGQTLQNPSAGNYMREVCNEEQASNNEQS